jgi:hypothetical protein
MTIGIAQEIDQAIEGKDFAMQIAKLPAETSREVHHRFVLSCCTKTTIGEGFYWDDFREPKEFIRDPDGWRRVNEFVPESERNPDAYLLFNYDDDSTVYRMPIKYIVPIIEDCFGFEFYVVGLNFNWVFCHNHHDAICLQGETALVVRRSRE